MILWVKTSGSTRLSLFCIEPSGLLTCPHSAGLGWRVGMASPSRLSASELSHTFLSPRGVSSSRSSFSRLGWDVLWPAIQCSFFLCHSASPFPSQKLTPNKHLAPWTMLKGVLLENPTCDTTSSLCHNCFKGQWLPPGLTSGWPQYASFGHSDFALPALYFHLFIFLRWLCFPGSTLPDTLRLYLNLSLYSDLPP